ncbi:HAMP domain-containing sensor histidine kinase [Halorubrum sp. BV1]|uniref:GAF domain-containing sensor histidine kinase n=1 Tax=Halorubrum sp. BV1 TaxID=1498500 RepID=UPI0006793440|nr:HAMP domain-containing sensor histidine kinase [Halorubrum sp. BV1]
MVQKSTTKLLNAAFISGVGASFLYSTSWHALSGEPVQALLFGSVIPGLIALCIIATGVVVYRYDFPIQDGWRIIGWMAIFIPVGVGIATSLGIYVQAHGSMLVHFNHIIINTIIGSVGLGILVGMYDVGRKQQERRLNVETRILDTVREIHRGIVTAETQSSLEQHVCETLAESEPYLFAWIGNLNASTGEVVPRVAAGIGDEYLDSITINVDDEATAHGPTAKAIRTGEPHGTQNIREDPEYEPWRDEAIEYGFQSSLAVPIVYQDTTYGVLNIYANRLNAFNDREQDTLAELGETFGHAIHTIHEEQARIRENERLDRFASIVSHDLKNPLNVATGRLSIAMEDCDNDSLVTVQSSLGRMEEIIDDALTLARSGGAIDQVKPIEMASVATACWQTVPTASASLQIETELTIYADESQLQQLLENLFENAVKHGGEDVTIRVGALPDRDGFYVADDGTGVPDDERDRIFEPEHTTKHGSTGLGLLIVKEIADAHGWTVSVAESKTGGARFEIAGVDVGESATRP